MISLLRIISLFTVTHPSPHRFQRTTSATYPRHHNPVTPPLLLQSKQGLMFVRVPAVSRASPLPSLLSILLILPFLPSITCEILHLDYPNDPLSSGILISTAADSPPFIYFQSLLYPPSSLNFNHVQVIPNLYNAGGTFNILTFPTQSYSPISSFDPRNEDSVKQYIPPSVGTFTETIGGTQSLKGVKQWTVCCSEQMISMSECNSLNSPILNNYPYKYHTQPLSPSNTTVTHKISSPPKNLYTTIIFACVSSQDETILGTGWIEIFSRGSMLPIYLSLTYLTYLVLTVVTVLVSLFYIVNLGRANQRDVLLLHKFLTPLPFIATLSLTLLVVYYKIYR